MNQKPSIPKGTRDFGPVPMMRRNYLFSTIRSIFELYGYQPIETPAMETLDTLLGKYGEEGDKLVFKILNSGDFAGKIPKDLAEKVFNENDQGTQTSRLITSYISEKALRYDLTVPFARFVVQHREEITFPFKRYQIQPVWRADRPQKGRYREFYQCDVDVIGSNSLLNEAELIRIIDAVFTRLGIPVIIKINNRKILAALAEIIGHPDKLTSLTVALDKVEKIGFDEVSREWLSLGIQEQEISRLKELLTVKGTNTEILAALKAYLLASDIGIKGLEEIGDVFHSLNNFVIKSPVEIDLTLARGLNYYTGAIIEVKAQNIQIGSICGGGRYDDLTGIFGMPGVSGVGVSFGADRIYDVLDQTKSFPSFAQTATQVLFMNFGHDDPNPIQSLAEELRSLGIRTEVYPDPVKIRKQLQYADQNHIPIVIMIGEEEIKSGFASVKNMITGHQENISMEEITRHMEKIAPGL